MGDQKVQTGTPAKAPSKPEPATKAPEQTTGPTTPTPVKAPAPAPTPATAANRLHRAIGSRRAARRARAVGGPEVPAPSATGTSKDAAAAADPLGGLAISRPEEPAEKEAEDVARKVAAGESARVGSAGGPNISGTAQSPGIGKLHRVPATGSKPAAGVVQTAPSASTGTAGTTEVEPTGPTNTPASAKTPEPPKDEAPSGLEPISPAPAGAAGAGGSAPALSSTIGPIPEPTPASAVPTVDAPGSAAPNPGPATSTAVPATADGALLPAATTLAAAPASEPVDPATGAPASTPVPAGPEAGPDPVGAQAPGLADQVTSADVGESIPQPTLGILEQRLGADLGYIRLHRGAEADNLARRIAARAFTRGNDIWLASDASPFDIELMAHEVTHVLQGIPGTIHRDPESTSTASGKESEEIRSAKPPLGVMKYGTSLEFSNPPKVPKFKEPYHSGTGLKWRSDKQRDETVDELTTKEMEEIPDVKFVAGKADQRYFWKKNTIRKVQDNLWSSKYEGSRSEVKAFKELGQDSFIYVGTADEVGERIAFPRWNKDLKFTETLQVDHRKEWQLGGSYDDMSNLWLLERSPNLHSGLYIRESIRQQIEDFLNDAQVKPVLLRLNPKLNLKEILKPVHLGMRPESWQVTWKPGPMENTNVKYPAADTHGTDTGNAAATADMLSKGLGANDYWEESEIGGPKHLAGLTPTDIPGDDPNILSIFPQRSGGGQVRRLHRNLAGGSSGDPKNGETSWNISNFNGSMAERADMRSVWELNGFTWFGASGSKPSKNGEAVLGQFSGKLFPQRKTLNDKNEEIWQKAGLEKELNKVDLLALEGVKWGGYYDRETMLKKFAKIDVPYFSPVQFADLGFDLVDGFSGHGSIEKPTIKLLDRVQIGVEVGGEHGIDVYATITGDQLNLPGPFKTTGGELTLGVGAGGLMVGGQLDFAIQGLGTGYVKGLAAQKEGGPSFALEGKLLFDKKLFTKAELGVTYQDQKWGVSGELEVGPGKIKGIRRANAKINVSDETVSADGSFEPDFEGIESGHLGLRYSEATGTEITGDLVLGQNIPGIKGGALSATISKAPGSADWSLAASGTAQPKIPGLPAQLTVSYKDGIFDASVQAEYSKGMMSGSLMVGATNRPVGSDGKPGEQPGTEISAYGGGQMTVRLSPMIAGTVGAQVNKKGELDFLGEIAAPNAIDLFGEKSVQKDIFTISIDIPIFGVVVPVVKQRVGIFATIQGGAGVRASIGPGQLRNASLRVNYNPEHEDQTKVTGAAQVYVPAFAGLRLFIRAGIGAGIPLVSVEGGLEIGGELGIRGEATAGVKVDWTPTQGFDVTAQAAVSAEPVFRFDIGGYVKAEASVGFFSYDLYSKHWEFAALEYGSGLKLGVQLPVHYQEGKPFDLSLSDVQFDVPQIDPKQILTDLIKRIA